MNAVQKYFDEGMRFFPSPQMEELAKKVLHPQDLNEALFALDYSRAVEEADRFLSKNKSDLSAIS